MSRHARTLVIVLALVAAPQVAFARTPAELNQAGKAAYDRGDFAAAEQLFGGAVAALPGEPLFHYHRGVALIRLGRFAEARASYERALRLKPPAPLAATLNTALGALTGPRAAIAPASTEAVAIPLESANGVWWAEVTLNGARRVRLLVDTGATWCTISPDLAEALGIPVPDNAPVIELITGNGRTEGRLVSLDSIRIGEVEAVDVPTVVKSLEPGFEGVLGNTFLARYAVTLDAQQKVLYLKPRSEGG